MEIVASWVAVDFQNDRKNHASFPHQRHPLLQTVQERSRRLPPLLRARNVDARKVRQGYVANVLTMENGMSSPESAIHCDHGVDGDVFRMLTSDGLKWTSRLSILNYN